MSKSKIVDIGKDKFKLDNVFHEEDGEGVDIDVESREERELEVTIGKWGDKIGLKLLDVVGVGNSIREGIFGKGKKKVSVEGNAIVWRKGEHEIRTYDKGFGLEYEIVLSKRIVPFGEPLGFYFELAGIGFRGDNKYKLYYQGKLSDREREEGIGREEKYEGSFAIYGNYRGGKFKTGKIGHIERPRIIDAVGKEYWGIMTSDGENLSIIIPSDVLEDVIYPITIDPTFGYTIAGVSFATWTGNRWYAVTGIPSSGNGEVDSIVGYANMSNSSNTMNVKAMLVDKSSKVIVSNGIGNGVLVSGVSAAWYTSNYSGSKPSVVNGTSYYVGMIGDSGADFGRFWFDGGAPANESAYDASNNYTSPSDPTDLGTQARFYSFYANYTVSGAGGTVSRLPILGCGD